VPHRANRDPVAATRLAASLAQLTSRFRHNWAVE
jgi:hypothetical protein